MVCWGWTYYVRDGETWALSSQLLCVPWQVLPGAAGPAGAVRTSYTNSLGSSWASSLRVIYLCALCSGFTCFSLSLLGGVP